LKWERFYFYTVNDSIPVFCKTRLNGCSFSSRCINVTSSENFLMFRSIKIQFRVSQSSTVRVSNFRLKVETRGSEAKSSRDLTESV